MDTTLGRMFVRSLDEERRMISIWTEQFLSAEDKRLIDRLLSCREDVRFALVDAKSIRIYALFGSDDGHTSRRRWLGRRRRPEPPAPARVVAHMKFIAQWFLWELEPPGHGVLDASYDIYTWEH